MASIIGGYEYDIFVSYRQKDNEYDGWVTEFVDNLKRELHATFKEDISIYFDANPIDGLLETHIVDESLSRKLKCLIFLPIVSQTYCDTQSFAWKNEFCVFNKLAKEDHIGRDIRLASGNVASRILPVKINDLEPEDNDLVAKELGSVLRSVDFIYKASGVNRPLRPNDQRAENINHTYYRDQINKLANAIKEIISTIKKLNQPELAVPQMETKVIPIKNRKTKYIIVPLIILSLLMLGFFFIPKIFPPFKPTEKSIAILPFKNISNDPGQKNFVEAMREVILSHLFKIGGLNIPSSTSSMSFNESKLSLRQIARKLNVFYILEGNIYSTEDSVRIIVSLINGNNEKVCWVEEYNMVRTANNLLWIQSEVAQKIAEKMSVLIIPDVKKRIEARPTENTEAYNLYLQTYNNSFLPFDQGRANLEKAIVLDPKFADAYALLAQYWIFGGALDGHIKREVVLEKATPLLEKAIELDKNSLIAHLTKAMLSLYYNWDFESVEREFKICTEISPSNSEFQSFFADYLLAAGKYHEAFLIMEEALKKDENSLFNWVETALTLYYDGQPDNAVETIETADLRFPNFDFIYRNRLQIYVYAGKYNKAIELFEKTRTTQDLNSQLPINLGQVGIAYYKSGQISYSTDILNELLSKSKTSPIGSPSFYAAAVYSFMDKKDSAIQMLEKAYNDHEVEMYWLKVEPYFRPLHGDPRFENILAKIGFK